MLDYYYCNVENLGSCGTLFSERHTMPKIQVTCCKRKRVWGRSMGVPNHSFVLCSENKNKQFSIYVRVCLLLLRQRPRFKQYIELANLEIYMNSCLGKEVCWVYLNVGTSHSKMSISYPAWWRGAWLRDTRKCDCLVWIEELNKRWIKRGRK